MLIEIIVKNKKCFVPAAGDVNDGVANNVGLNGNLWSSSLYESNVEKAYNLNFNSSNSDVENDNRFNGIPVRGVV